MEIYIVVEVFTDYETVIHSVWRNPNLAQSCIDKIEDKEDPMYVIERHTVK